METATLDLTYGREELVGKLKILSLGEKDHEILEFMVTEFLRRWMLSNLENRYYSKT